MEPVPLMPPWAKPGGHEDTPRSTLLTVGNISLFPGAAPPEPPDLPQPQGEPS